MEPARPDDAVIDPAPPPPGLWSALGTSLLLSTWFALLAGLADWGTLVLRKEFHGEVMRLSWQAAWMFPLATWTVYVGPALLVGWLRWRLPRRVGWRAVFLVPLFLALWHLLLMLHKLHAAAALLLAFGAAFQLSRYLAADAEQLLRLARITLLPLLLFPLGWTAYQAVSRAAAERQAIAGLPPAPTDAPNVVLLVIDTVRMESASLGGYGRATTPELARLAARGVSFERAIAPSSWTLPTHASLFTGRWPHELTADWQLPLDDRYPTLAEFFAGRGYLTAGFVGNLNFCHAETGLDRGFLHYADYYVCSGEIYRGPILTRELINSYWFRSLAGFYDDYGRKTAPQVNRECLDWLDQQEQRPFFVFLNYFDAHHPFLPPPPYQTLFGPAPSASDQWLFQTWWHEDKLELTPAQVQSAADAYDGGIAWIDHELTNFLEELRRRGRLDNTLIVIVSDHGEQFGEHGLYAHGNSLYAQLVHVPLVLIYPPKLAAGQTRPEIVSLRDLPATVLDLLDVKEHPFPGASLAGAAASRPVLAEVSDKITFHPDHGRSPVFRGPLRSLFLDGMHYIKNDGDGQEELYDFLRDPRESTDVSQRNDLTRFRQGLDALSPPPRR